MIQSQNFPTMPEAKLIEFAFNEMTEEVGILIDIPAAPKDGVPVRQVFVVPCSVKMFMDMATRGLSICVSKFIHHLPLEDQKRHEWCMNTAKTVTEILKGEPDEQG